MQKIKKLIKTLKNKKRIFIQTHNYPDHDAVASAFALQYLLKMKLATTQQSANAAKATAEAISTLGQTTPVTIRCAITVIAAVPIIIVYPFLQKYFVTGIALGSVKE